MRILSFGEIVWDIYPDNKTLGGAPLNFAAHCALQKADSWIISAVGDDELGKIAVDKIKTFGVNTEYISVISQKETGKCLVTLDENAVATYNLCADVAYDFIKLPLGVKSGKFDVLAFGTLALRSENNIEIVKELINMKICSDIYCDLNIRAPFYSKETIEFCLRNATIIKISEEELPIITQSIWGCDTELKQAMVRLADAYKQIKIIVLTCGEKGAFAYDCTNKQIYSAESVKTKVVSTVGAGDSFGAAFLYQYINKSNIQECLEYASKVAGFVVSVYEAIPEYQPEQFE